MAKATGFASIDIGFAPNNIVLIGDTLVHEPTGLEYRVLVVHSITSVEIEALIDGSRGNLPVGSLLRSPRSFGRVLFLRGGADEVPPPRMRTSYERLIEDD